LVLRQAAELLFARLGPDHPNAGVRVFRVVGTERRLGATHNVEERPRIEGNLPEVWQEAISVIGGLMRQPSRLVGNRFQAVSEYPRFSWQEALLNAIAHRDYSIQGNCIEVWLFDDRMEVVSPGGLLPELDLQELLSRKRVHCSRNPRLMRTLVDLGLTRDQGEGIPRMFAEMEDAFLPAPRIEPTARNVSVVLGNTTTLTEADRTFVERLAAEDLTQEEFRALLQAHRHTQVDNASLRQLMGLDTLAASQVLRRLRDRSMLELHRAGPQSFYTLGPGLLADDRPGQGHLILDRGGTEHATEHVAEHVTEQVLQLLRACRGEQSRADLMDAVGLTHREHFREAYLVPALAVGYLEMTIPDKPKSSRQKYRLTPAGHTFLNTFPIEQP
jgi:ATP-dependent DNA helicase RecG